MMADNLEGVLKQLAIDFDTLSPLEIRIKMYNYIKEIPYGIIAVKEQEQKGAVEILEKNIGSCTPKHLLLGMLFEHLNIPVHYVSFKFNWNDPRINYPNHLKIQVENLPYDYHFACKALLNGKWILIDATWDSPLKKMGYPVNENWNGISDTANAVIPMDEVIHANANERIKFLQMVKSAHSREQKELEEKWYLSLNDWFKASRPI